jgi:ATP-binding cassette, subfamily B, bacterial
VIWCMIIVIAANAGVFGALGFDAVSGGLPLDRLVVYVQVALGVSLIAFGGLNWALDGAAAPVAAVARLRPSMARLGRLVLGQEPARVGRSTTSASVICRSDTQAASALSWPGST